MTGAILKRARRWAGASVRRFRAEPGGRPPFVGRTTYLQDGNQWYLPPVVGPSSFLRETVGAAPARRVLDVLGKLTSDPYMDFVLRFYEQGLRSFGDAWCYADLNTVLLGLARVLRPETYLEIGVRRGRSMAMVASQAPHCSIVGFDLWIPDYAGMSNPGEDFVRRELGRVGYAGQVEFVSGDSRETPPLTSRRAGIVSSISSRSMATIRRAEPGETSRPPCRISRSAARSSSTMSSARTIPISAAYGPKWSSATGGSLRTRSRRSVSVSPLRSGSGNGGLLRPPMRVGPEIAPRIEGEDAPLALDRVIVTGASGFIGQALTRRLMELDCEVVAVDRLPFPGSASRAVEVDLTEPRALIGELDDRTTVFHLAACADVPGSVADPRRDFESTLRAAFEVLEAVRLRRSRLVLPSTASVYDPANPLPLAERAFPRPTSPYAAAKLAAESYCYAYQRSYGLDLRVARLFSVYGIGMRRFAIHDIVRKIQSDANEIVILGDGRQIRDYLYVDDAVEGLLRVATRGEPGEDYNLASGSPVTILELTRTIAELMGHPDIRIVPSGRSFPGDTSKWYGDVSKSRRLGFEPKVTLRAGLQRTIAWLTRVPRMEPVS